MQAQEGSDLSRFGFMFKKISVHPIFLRMWLEIPEFTDRIDEMMATNITVDNQSVYDLMQRVYGEKSVQHDPKFNQYKARRSMRELEKSLIE